MSQNNSLILERSIFMTLLWHKRAALGKLLDLYDS